jgi:hypothetical protein
MIRKVTTGIVVQWFDDAGRCHRQLFVATDDVSYETDDGPIAPEDTPLCGREYYPFDLVQPD